MRKAAKELYPNAQSIEWDFKVLKVDGVVVDHTGLAEREIEIENAGVWLKNRQEEYAALNQFELMFDDKTNGTSEWIKAIKAIKTKYPKPS